MGWSDRRFVCVGQNDFSCLISPKMFDEFCLTDTVECANHVDRTIYHLDGPGALKHLPRILAIRNDLRQRLHRAISQSAALDPADWQRRPWLRRMLSWLAYEGVRLMVGLAGGGRWV